MYKQINDFVVQKLDENIFIPVDVNNTDYKEFLAWQASGGVLLSADGGANA